MGFLVSLADIAPVGIFLKNLLNAGVTGNIAAVIVIDGYPFGEFDPKH